ncbi:GDSL-type esterase/lipase family protein [Flavobacterium sp.]|uniref:GDSL-type esterase/lipase family protein n=1 Tax=Flavobacterium sp. TaxID=239 RepID=UPI003D0C508E
MIFLRRLWPFLFFFFQGLYAQKDVQWQPKRTDSLYPSIVLNYEKNLIQNPTSLGKLFQKLKELKQGSQQNVSFVHIGDSHIQADMETAIIRKEMQGFFGNAGRGLIFPYQLAHSNAPSDLIFNSNNDWKGNRLIKKNSEMTCGVSGFVLKSPSGISDFNFHFRSIKDSIYNFNKITLFSTIEANKLMVEPFKIEHIDAQIAHLVADKKVSIFKLQLRDTIPTKIFGIVLENSFQKGILYHAIGVNGAKYSDYNETPLFWDQLAHLKSDCYIFSMGTNEAQNQSLTPEVFIQSVANSIEKIRSFNPQAIFILITPPVSYFQKHSPNQKLKAFSEALVTFAKEEEIAVWDLFEISMGLEGANQWKTKQLLGADLVHFTRKGYEFQGHLFIEAFAKSWNSYLKNN